MAFTKEPTKTATAVGAIRILLYENPNAGPPINGLEQTVTYEVEIIYSDGSREWRRGNLLPHLTQTQINSLLAFMSAMRTKAVAEFIG